RCWNRLEVGVSRPQSRHAKRLTPICESAENFEVIRAFHRSSRTYGASAFHDVGRVVDGFSSRQ
ncbi:MAG: hypothetical protein ACK55I_22800, partial [bacterium]